MREKERKWLTDWVMVDGSGGGPGPGGKKSKKNIEEANLMELDIPHLISWISEKVGYYDGSGSGGWNLKRI